MINDKEVGLWWEERVNQRSIWRTDELPDPTYKARLLLEGLAHEVRRDVLCLCAPDRSDPAELVLLRYWEIVAAVLEPYAPFAIQGPSAMRLHLDDPSVAKTTFVATERSRTRVPLLPEPELELVLDKDTPPSAPLEIATNAGGVVVDVETPESALIRIMPRHLRDERDLVITFLKATPFDLDRLKALCRADPRPAKFRALAEWCAQLGREEVASVLRAGRARPRSRTPLPAPAALLVPARRGEAAYVTRFVDELRSLREAIDAHLEHRFDGALPLASVISIADEKKKLDTYHSSTIEGYRVSPEEIDHLMGRMDNRGGGSTVDVERRMALVGYLEAHRYTVAAIERMFGKSRTLTEGLVQDIRAALFEPSITAGLSSAAELRAYRRRPVYLRGSRHMPPRWEKVDALMQRAVEEINDVDDFAARAVLIHYAMVTIHPYEDGNGRTARLLMNFVLGAAGAPWVTIRVEDRDAYFRALERAQVDADFVPLIDLHRRYFTGGDT